MTLALEVAVGCCVGVVIGVVLVTIAQIWWWGE